jgi:hypothetical protein
MGATMIDRQHNQIVIECDACENTFDGDSLDWEVVWPAAKREGWKARKIADEWMHFCSECKP